MSVVTSWRVAVYFWQCDTAFGKGFWLRLWRFIDAFLFTDFQYKRYVNSQRRTAALDKETK